ncbi:putative transcriptional regulator, IclR family protein (plasmid) [Paraburkholderia sp. PGU19]|uniref:IclR family transcriptional regulator n=1 Tax=Paraburkholderia sp. PGU19 TaxID=2735434 RepID=UPI0015DBB8E7|nr:IclR family transcriptional regulator [Paraburkholderia sp. PGU19]BCG04451.1 putative transcriptional regulator, IclR family protein [Paraburkholderia sp. PGU19]
MPTLVPAAARALAIFEIFAREKRELTNSELAKFLGVAESSCSDLVNTLIGLGYINRAQQSRTLYPTSRLFFIASEVNTNDWRGAKIQQVCEALRDKTGESALCGALSNRSVTVLAFSPGRDPLRYTRSRGDRISLHVSSIGKAILAKLPVEQVAKELGNESYERLTPNTLTEPVELARQVEEFRHKGWAYLENEGSEGLASIAVSGPIGGELLAFSITGAQPRIRRNQVEYLNALKELCAGVFDHD